MLTIPFMSPLSELKKIVSRAGQTLHGSEAEQVGTYQVLCAEYCGLNHSYMYSAVKVLPKNDYNKWMAEQLKKTGVAIRIMTQQQRHN